MLPLHLRLKTLIERWLRFRKNSCFDKNVRAKELSELVLLWMNTYDEYSNSLILNGCDFAVRVGSFAGFFLEALLNTSRVIPRGISPPGFLLHKYIGPVLVGYGDGEDIHFIPWQDMPRRSGNLLSVELVSGLVRLTKSKINILINQNHQYTINEQKWLPHHQTQPKQRSPSNGLRMSPSIILSTSWI